MHFSITVALAAFPFLVGAVPAHNSRDNLLSIPLSKRWLSQSSDNGSAPGNISLTATNRTFSWAGTIQVGTPSKEYSVVFDTGSADLLLFGPSCPTCQGHDIYDPSQSSTANDLKTPFNFTYSFGNLTGDVFTDSVAVGGFKVSNETLGVISITGANYNATNFGADGVLGMGFKGLSLYNSSSVFETLVNGSQLPEPVVGMVLADSNPELIVGGRDSSRYKGDLVYTPVDTNNTDLWDTTLDVIDSGRPLILGDRESIANIYAGIPGSSRLNVTDPKQNPLWTYPCNTTVNASIVISKTSFNIPSENFNYTTIGGGLCTGVFAEFVADIEDPGFWVLGNGFLRNVYTELDYGKLQIGFGQLA
ncbi:aspartic peptidase domain-containing protein [Russula vinacea]|nr:aspartic peptidase domain-containing protein [Russula vinacea]